jgi:hypothetical protein
MAIAASSMTTVRFLLRACMHLPSFEAFVVTRVPFDITGVSIFAIVVHTNAGIRKPLRFRPLRPASAICQRDLIAASVVGIDFARNL